MSILSEGPSKTSEFIFGPILDHFGKKYAAKRKEKEMRKKQINKRTVTVLYQKSGKSFVFPKSEINRIGISAMNKVGYFTFNDLEDNVKNKIKQRSK